MREKLGRKGVEAPFFQKKVEAKNLFSEAFRTREENGSPLWNFWSRSFPQAHPGKTSLWKTVEKPQDLHILRGENKMRPRGRTARRGAGVQKNLYSSIDAVDGDFAGKDPLLAAVGADDELAVGVHVDGRAAAQLPARQVEGDVTAQIDAGSLILLPERREALPCEGVEGR